MICILLVEDNRMDAELALNALKEVAEQPKVYVATDGQQALDYLTGRGRFADRDTYPLPDLILLDLKLPFIDGNGLLSLVKSMPIIRRIPVVIFTSSIEEQDRVQCYEKGCNSYVEKPHSYDGYIALMRELDSYWFHRNAAPPYWA